MIDDYANSTATGIDDDVATESRSLLSKLHNAVKRGVGLFIRQSSDRQVKENIGSNRFQQDNAKVLISYGVSAEDIRVFDASGESGHGIKDRPVFRSLLDAVARGDIGVVILAWTNRSGRNEEDDRALQDTLARERGILIVRGQIMDPSDPGHQLLLSIQSAIARFENVQRILVSLTAQGALAKRLHLRIPMPAGLMWADPENPEYVKCAETAGITDALSGSSLALHKARSIKDGSTLYVLPHPDREVLKGAALTVSWLLETRSLREVVRRIQTDPEWPVPGHFMYYNSRLFPAFEERSRLRHPWRPIVDRADGRDEYAPGVIRDWLRSPALYGIYARSSPALAEMAKSEVEALGVRVWAEDAFPGLVDPLHRPEILEILESSELLPPRARNPGPRNHFLPTVRCLEWLPNGELCDLKLQTCYPSNREGHSYRNATCSRRGHGGHFGSEIDSVALDLVRDEYSREVISGILEGVAVRNHASQSERLDVVRKLNAIEDTIDAASRNLERSTSPDITTHWEGRLTVHLSEKHRLQSRLRHLERVTEAEGSASEAELRDVLELAEDIPRLLTQAVQVEGLVRDTLRHLTRLVRVRKVGENAILVQVEFPSGLVRSRVHTLERMRVAEGVKAYCAIRMGGLHHPAARLSKPGEDEARERAQVVVSELEKLLPEGNDLGTAWNAARVLGAALRHEPAGREGKPDKDWLTVQEIAAKCGVSEEEVLAQGLRDRLGPVRVEDSRILFASAAKHLQKAFPEYARRHIASSNGWDLDDTVAVSELRRELDLSWEEMKSLQSPTAQARDKAGRRYTKRSATSHPEDLDRDLPSLKTLPPPPGRPEGQWVSMKEAKLQFPGVHRQTFWKHAPCRQPGWGYLGSRSVYVWIDETTIRQIREAARGPSRGSGERDG